MVSMVFFGGVAGGLVGAGDIDGAVVLDVDLGAGVGADLLMTLPPEPMTSRILSTSIFIFTILGAVSATSGRARRCRGA